MTRGAPIGATLVVGVVLTLLGIAMIVETLMAWHGGGVPFGLVFGPGLMLAGALRLYMVWKGRGD